MSLKTKKVDSVKFETRHDPDIVEMLTKLAFLEDRLVQASARRLIAETCPIKLQHPKEYQEFISKFNCQSQSAAAD